jgi:hypothetical protein
MVAGFFLHRANIKYSRLFAFLFWAVSSSTETSCQVTLSCASKLEAHFNSTLTTNKRAVNVSYMLGDTWIYSFPAGDQLGRIVMQKLVKGAQPLPAAHQ